MKRRLGRAGWGSGCASSLAQFLPIPREVLRIARSCSQQHRAVGNPVDAIARGQHLEQSFLREASKFPEASAELYQVR